MDEAKNLLAIKKIVMIITISTEVIFETLSRLSTIDSILKALSKMPVFARSSVTASGDVCRIRTTIAKIKKTTGIKLKRNPKAQEEA